MISAQIGGITSGAIEAHAASIEAVRNMINLGQDRDVSRAWSKIYIEEEQALLHAYINTSVAWF